MSDRKTVLQNIAKRIAALSIERAIVAIDGVDGSGKTTFADALAPFIEAYGRPVIRAGVDGFHNPRAIRYQRGKADPEGYFRDSYNYELLRCDLIDPFRAGNAIQTARFDHVTDQEVSAPVSPPARAVLLIDGIFLHRDELSGLWDQSIFLDVPFAVSYARMAIRDGSDPDPRAPANRRYYEGQQLYLQTCGPQDRATILIDNAEAGAPRILADRSIG